MNWADLHILLAVARTDSLTAAGRSLGLDQTTVSRRLGRLEEALGASLVVRSRDGHALTPAGERLVRAAELVETTVLDAERDLLGRDRELQGRLRIASADILVQHGAALMGSFIERYPQVELEVTSGSTQRSLSRREADVALRFTAKPEPQLVGRKLVRFAYAPYAAEVLVKRIGRRARLDRFPWLGWDSSLGARGTERWMAKHAKAAKVIARFDAWAALHAAAVAGLGAAIMPCVYADSSGLIRLRRPVDELGYDLWVLTHEDLRRTARVRAFIEHAAAFMQARRRAIEGDAGAKARIQP
ncbi:MAG: LysR family transcriptional regulator [Myxococcales bacterium]|nr:LysR family transcriptional regulator [Myxococcales bacterium]